MWRLFRRVSQFDDVLARAKGRNTKTYRREAVCDKKETGGKGELGGLSQQKEKGQVGEWIPIFIQSMVNTE